MIIWNNLQNEFSWSLNTRLQQPMETKLQNAKYWDKIKTNIKPDWVTYIPH